MLGHGGFMKRSSYMRCNEIIQLSKRGLVLWAYGKTEEFVCRIEISAAGIAVYKGKKGRDLIGDFSWEEFVERLSN